MCVISFFGQRQRVLRDGALPRRLLFPPLWREWVRSSKSLYHANPHAKPHSVCESLCARGNKGLCRARTPEPICAPLVFYWQKSGLHAAVITIMNAPTSNFVTPRVPPGRTHPGHFVVACHINFPAADEPLIPPFSREERADFNFRPLCEQSINIREGTGNAVLHKTQFAHFNIRDKSKSSKWQKILTVWNTKITKIWMSHFATVTVFFSSSKDDMKVN